MPTTYQKAPHDVAELVDETASRFHTDLVKAGVRYDLMFAYGPCDDETGEKLDDPLKLRGVACLAIVRVVNLRDRAKGMGDAEIAFDADRWPDLTPQQREALVDHELEHLVLKRDRQDEVKLDDLGRPKLAIKTHDFDVGGFYSVIRRHSAAIELESLARVGERLRQREFEFADVDGEADNFRHDVADAFRAMQARMAEKGLELSFSTD